MLETKKLHCQSFPLVTNINARSLLGQRRLSKHKKMASDYVNAPLPNVVNEKVIAFFSVFLIQYGFDFSFDREAQALMNRYFNISLHKLIGFSRNFSRIYKEAPFLVKISSSKHRKMPSASNQIGKCEEPSS